MPRSARRLEDGASYHVLTRGNNGQRIFQEDVDYQRYLQLWSRYAAAHQVVLYHFVLLPTQVHLVVQATLGAQLSRAMQGLNLAYSLFYRTRYAYRGHLWQERFKSVRVDRERDLLRCGRSVELHPLRAGIAHDPRDYAWSSYRVYAEGAAHPLLRPNPLYQTLGDSPAARQQCYRQGVRADWQAWLACRHAAQTRRMDGTSPLSDWSTDPGQGLSAGRSRGRPRTRRPSDPSALTMGAGTIPADGATRCAP